MIFYLTYNEQPSGIFSSQVIDVVRFMNHELRVDVKLVSLISIRNYFKNRRTIKEQWPEGIVLPITPGIGRWKWNRITMKILIFLFSPDVIIARSVLATNLVLGTNVQKIVYDGRGAISAEWQEYNVIEDNNLLIEINGLERRAILESNFRIAVSEQLVNFWRENYSYNSNEHVVIPCTLNNIFEKYNLSIETITRTKYKMGLSNKDIVFVYSGSNAGWQSSIRLREFLSKHLRRSDNYKVLFLSDKSQFIDQLVQDFPSQVMHMKVKASEVPELLSVADYGLLIRESSVTNMVASPVKFAEYLACGLKVIISENLGDYTDFVKQNNCGFSINNEFEGPISQVNMVEKLSIRKLCLNNFTKIRFTKMYEKVTKFS